MILPSRVSELQMSRFPARSRLRNPKISLNRELLFIPLHRTELQRKFNMTGPDGRPQQVRPDPGYTRTITDEHKVIQGVSIIRTVMREDFVERKKSILRWDVNVKDSAVNRKHAYCSTSDQCHGPSLGTFVLATPFPCLPSLKCSFYSC